MLLHSRRPPPPPPPPPPKPSFHAASPLAMTFGVQQQRKFPPPAAPIPPDPFKSEQLRSSVFVKGLGMAKEHAVLLPSQLLPSAVLSPPSVSADEDALENYRADEKITYGYIDPSLSAEQLFRAAWRSTYPRPSPPFASPSSPETASKDRAKRVVGRKEIEDAELAAWASIQGSPLLLAPWKVREESDGTRRDAQLDAQLALRARLLLPDTVGVTSSALDRLHASIGFHGAFSSERGASFFRVIENVVVLSLPRSSLVSKSPPDMLGGERVLVIVGDSTRTLDEQDSSGCNCCGDQNQRALSQLSIAILLPGASKFAPLLSLSYTTHDDHDVNVYGDNTTSWGVTVDKGTSEALEE